MTSDRILSGVDHRLALFAHPAGSGFLPPQCDPHDFSTFRANQHHLGHIQGGLELDHPRIHRTAAGLDLPLVLLVQVGPLHHHPPFLRQGTQHFAAHPLVATTDDFDGVAFLDLHAVSSAAAYRTSGASETILVKPRSRSSRATGPKLRVPFGLTPSASRITAALSSKRMVEPSSRRYSLAVRTMTALTISLLCTAPCGAADLTAATTTSPIVPVRRRDPPMTWFTT